MRDKTRLERPIGMADVVLAYAALKPKTDEEKRQIANLLGFNYTPSEDPTPPREKKKK